MSIRPEPFFFETITNPQLEGVDVSALTSLAKSGDADDLIRDIKNALEVLG